MEKTTTGAWIVHHGRKVAASVAGPSEYSALDIAAKSTELLIRMSGSDEETLPESLVNNIAKYAGLNPKTELPACLAQLRQQRVIDVSASGEVVVLGITASSALGHAADLFEKNEPEPHERAAIGLGEITSIKPVSSVQASEYISDEYKLPRATSSDYINQFTEYGFIDSDGIGDDKLLFNGNLFRRNTASKTLKVLDSLSEGERTKFSEFQEYIKKNGAMPLKDANRMLGSSLLSKLRAAAVFDENIVSNETGDHSFITSPGAFHKFVNPMEDDAFDLAKALVAALSYGIRVSAEKRGRIWGVEPLLRKLLRGEEVGPAPAIGRDYRYLEFNRVVQIRSNGWRHMMKLLKRDVGEIALQVLVGGDATVTTVERYEDAGATSYTAPEHARSTFRRKTNAAQSRVQLDDLLRSVRSGGGL
ncbi:hypothetical protein [Maricaulis salignorans]|uniref:hypothetical protein n=1 Tax=Maricaulis salignorans TaxID=144026 RepID=UPI003A958DB0